MITNIQIENYKSIRKLDLDLCPINILIGANGAGKSNFISFFKLLKKMYDKNLQTHVGEEGGVDNLLYFGSKNSEYITGRIKFVSMLSVSNIYSFKIKPGGEKYFFYENEEIFYHEERYPNPIGIQIGSSNIESKLQDSTERIANYVKTYMNSFKVFHFHDTSSTSKMRKPSLIDDNSFLREDGGNLPAYLYWMQEKHPNDFKKIEMCIRSVAPYFDHFNLKPDRLHEDNIRLEWQEKDSDAYFNAKHLSDGTLRFIALATLLLQPNPPAVIIIDEPELGLHPFAINKLAALIQKVSVKTQIIVSTQSVNLVDNFSPNDIIVVDREDNQSVFNRQDSEALNMWLQDFSISDLWNKNVIGGTP